MKKKFYLLGSLTLLLFLLSGRILANPALILTPEQPDSATTLNNDETNLITQIILNGLNYQTTYPLKNEDGVCYIALDDLANMTFGKIDIDKLPFYQITLNNKEIRLLPQVYQVHIDGQATLLTERPFLLGEILYVPITLLDAIEYPYSIANDSLILDCIKPYSVNSINFIGDNFIETTQNLANLPAHLTIFSSKKEVQETIDAQLKQNGAISFVDQSNRQAFNKQLLSMTAKSPYNNLSVVIREVNLHAEKSSIIGLTTLPLSVTPTDTSLQIKIGEEIFDYETIWATFTPYATAKQMSLNKTIDVTLMNFLYEYFRDKIDLRDDLFFSPLLCLSNERTATLTYNTYFNDATHNTQEYDVFVYRVHPTGQLTYIVDIFKKTTPETQNIE